MKKREMILDIEPGYNDMCIIKWKGETLVAFNPPHGRSSRDVWRQFHKQCGLTSGNAAADLLFDNAKRQLEKAQQSVQIAMGVFEELKARWSSDRNNL